MYYELEIHTPSLISITVKSESTGGIFDMYSVTMSSIESAAIYLYGLKARFPGIKATRKASELTKLIKTIEESAPQ